MLPKLTRIYIYIYPAINNSPVILERKGEMALMLPRFHNFAGYSAPQMASVCHLDYNSDNWGLHTIIRLPGFLPLIASYTIILEAFK